MDIVAPTQDALSPTPSDPERTGGSAMASSIPIGGAEPAPARPDTSRRGNRARRTDVPALIAPPVAGASAPLVRPDGSPAPVIHLAPELSPYARTGGLGEAVASLAKYQAASGIPVTVFMPLYGVVRERTELSQSALRSP